MSDWIKLILTAVGSVAVVWSMIQQHDYRISQMETGMAKHLDAHTSDMKEIQRSLREIELELSRLER